MTYTTQDLFDFAEFFKNFYEVSTGIYKMRLDNTVYKKEEIIELFNKQK